MRRRVSGVWIWLAMIGSGATLFTTFPITGTTGAGYHGCQRFVSNGVSNSIDFCYLLDCQNGFFGGLVDPCADVSMGESWLLDCPEAAEAEEGTEDETTETDTSTETDTTTTE